MPEVERMVGAVAGRQRGLVTRAQLLGLGLTRREIERRLADGRLYLIHRGVYAVGHRELTPLARCEAGLLAVAGGVLSHRSAGVLWGMVATWPADPDVTVVRRGGTPPRGIALHRVRALDRRHVTARQGLAVTTPARTLLDLAEVLGMRELRRAIRQAEFDRRVDHRGLAQLLAASPGRHGVAALTEALGDGAPTRSELEDRFLKLLADAGLPRPRVNARVAGFTVDFVWDAHRVIVETDGWGNHGGRIAFEDDRERDQRLLAAGYRVMRITWRQLTRDPTKVAARLGALLAVQRPATRSASAASGDARPVRSSSRSARR